MLILRKYLMARIKKGLTGGDPKMKPDGQVKTEHLKPGWGVDPDATDRESTIEAGLRFFF